MSNDELWSEVFGSAYEMVTEWILDEEWVEGDWQTPGLVRITAEDPYGVDESLTREINLAELQKAYDEAVVQGFTHCGHVINDQDMDACAGDIVLQMAIYGDVIYG